MFNQPTAWCFVNHGNSLVQAIRRLTSPAQVQKAENIPLEMGGDTCYTATFSQGDIWIGLNAEGTLLQIISQPRGDGTRVWTTEIWGFERVLSEAILFLER